jgi:hypothetical protein
MSCSCLIQGILKVSNVACIFPAESPFSFDLRATSPVSKWAERGNLTQPSSEIAAAFSANTWDHLGLALISMTNL